MTDDSVQSHEFNRAIDGLSRQITRLEVKVDAVEHTSQKTLFQAMKTNGRVDVIELNAPLTKRDLWVAVGTLGATGGLVTFLLTLWAAGRS